MNNAAEDRPNHAMTAAFIGGAAAAATAGAFWSARAIARRNGVRGGRLSPMMEAAATACELAHSESATSERPERDDPGP